MASFQDRAQHTIAQLDKEVRFHCVFRWGLGSSPRFVGSQHNSIAVASFGFDLVFNAMMMWLVTHRG
jgi:hypothetical protein